MFGRMMAAPTALGGGVGAVAGAADAAAGDKAEGTDHAFRSQLDDAAKQFAALQAVVPQQVRREPPHAVQSGDAYSPPKVDPPYPPLPPPPPRRGRRW